MTESTRANPVYVALESKFSPSAANTPEPIFEISINPDTQKISLEKLQGRGFLRFEATQVMFIQKGDLINIGLWSIKNKKLLGTLTNQQGQWSTEDLQQIRQEFKAAGVKVKEKVQTGLNTTSESSSYVYDTFEEDIRDNLQRGNTTLTFLWIKVGLAILVVASIILVVLYLVSGGTFSPNTAANLPYAIVVFRYMIFVLTIAELVVYLFWLRRAYANLRKAGADTRFSDQYVAWSYFIPIIWWIHPFMILKEIWQKTQLKIKELVPSYKLRGAGLINAWWIASLFVQLSLIYVWFKLRMMGNELMRGDLSLVDYLKQSESLMRYQGFVGIVAFIFMIIFIVIFSRILQVEKHLYKIFLRLKVNSLGQETAE